MILGVRHLFKYVFFGNLVSIIGVIIFTLSFLCAHTQDTIRPQLILPARDTSFECGVNSDIISKLTAWYNIAGGATATDNSDSIVWQTNLTLQQAITIFNNSLDVLCGNTQKVEIIFTPSDTSGNLGMTTKASFFTRDTRGPRILNPVPNQNYSCIPGIRDTLIAWIKRRGGYNAADDCSNSISWKNFNYSITSNNNIIQTGGGNISNGPYPNIPDGICQWTMFISFIVADECGNETGTPGTTTFTVKDDIAPVFISPPQDITVGCSNVPNATELIVVDQCDTSAKAILTQTSTKATVDTLCSFYNYTITRRWNTSDKCGNIASHTQIITVRDTIGPSPVVNNPSVSCTTFDIKKDSIFLQYSDNCSKVKVTFSDSLISTGCATMLQRKYTLTDVCLNQTIYRQTIQIIQDAKPVISIQASNQSYPCTSQDDIEILLKEWIDNRGGSRATTSCGTLQSFAALKGSYNINDPNTYPVNFPVSLPQQVCPSLLNGFLRYIEVDFVYFDSCGNNTISSAVFGVSDDTAPVITNCPSPINLSVPLNDCIANVSIVVPKAADNCIEPESPVSRKTSVAITSSTPAGPEAIVNTVNMKIGPFNPALATPLNDGNVTIRLINLDIDDVTEYFTIFDESGTNIGRTPVGVGQCASIDIQLKLDKDKIRDWILDGFIELKFVPNIIPDNPVLSINNICGFSSIEATITYEIDIKNTVRKTYKINNGIEIPLTNQDTIKLEFSEGNHQVTFLFRDCANNTSQCVVPVNIKDEVAPSITCPTTITKILPIGKCTDTVGVPINFQVIENCSGNFKYDRKAPASTEASLISFVFNEAKQKSEARTKEMVFTNVFPIVHQSLSATLEIEFIGDNNEVGEFFEILGPGGFLIGNTALSSSVATGCQTSITRFEIPKDRLNSWIINGQITLIAVPKNDGDGINPCINITPSQSVDNISSIRGNLKYSDAQFSISIAGSTTIAETDIPKSSSIFNLLLNSGQNTATLKTKDGSGNQATCTFTIDIQDKEKPKAKCKNIVVDLHPSGLEQVSILPAMINDGSTDNCGIEKMSVIPNFVDCTSANSNVNVQLIIEDKQGNRDTCIAQVRVKAPEIKPTFSAGLCTTDTLKLFANVPPATIPGTYSFFWDGPGSNDFFVENPQIPGADESFNGVYVLTVKGFNNCTSVGSITVNIKPLTKPDLVSDEKEICSGGTIVLTSSSYSGGIEYLWYEGIFPTGVLIRTTLNPELIIKPTNGVHFYYIIAKGPDCSSTPSTLLRVEVKTIPVPETCNSFLSLCEGSNLTLCAKGSTTFTYSWIGPAGYTGSGQNPALINKISSQNAGEYRLVVANGQCVSDTAVTRVAVLEKPSKPTIVSADIFCEGAIFSMVITGSTNAEKYEWYKNNQLFTTSQENNLIIPNAQSGLQGSWTAISTKGNCKSDVSDTKFVAIDNSLQVGVINSSPVCRGDSVKLQATFVPNATYRWQGPFSPIPNVFDPVIPGVPGDYSVVITTPTGCQNNANTTVSVITAPEITALSNDAKPCMVTNDIIKFSPSVFPNSDIYTFAWTGPNGFNSTAKSLSITNLATKDTGIYSLVIFNGKCPSNRLQTRVSFQITPPKPMINSPTDYCEKDTIRILGGNLISGAEYHWNTPLGKVITTQPTLVIPAASRLNRGRYSLETKLIGCTSPISDSIFIEIGLIPEISALENDAKACVNSSDIVRFIPNIFPGSDIYTYQWTGPNSFASTLKSLVFNNLSPQDTGVYTLVVFNGKCASNKKETRVTFQMIPAKPIINSSAFYCETDTIRIRSLDSIGVQEYIWKTPIGTTSTTRPELIIPNSSISGKGKYSLEIKVNGCNSPSSDSIIIDVRPKPIKPILSGNSPVCYGDTVKILGPVTENSIYKWTTPGITSSSNSIVIPLATKTVGGNYILQITQNGCNSDPSSPFLVVVKDSITTPQFTLDVISLCADRIQGAEICIKPTTLEQGAVYDLTNQSNNVSIGSGNTSCYTINNPSLLAQGSNFIVVKASKDNCTSLISKPIVINVNSIPNIKAMAMENNIRTCPGESIRLVSISGPPLVNVKWTSQDPEVTISDRNSISPLVSGLKDGNNIVYLEYSIDGCTDFSRDTIKIYKEFAPIATADNYRLAYGDKGLLNILVNDNVPQENILSLVSTPQYGSAVINGNIIEYTPDLRYLRPVEIQYKVCADFCSELCSTATVKIEFDDNVVCKAPTIFTPNNDGINDNFIIPCLDSGRFPSNKLFIFNEWGSEVFSSSPYKNDWDGTFGGGSLPVGTYFYIMDTGDGQKPVNGFLILQR